MRKLEILKTSSKDCSPFNFSQIINIPLHIQTCCLTSQSVVSLVTGGASGLGKATVERFVREGARVALCDLPQSEGQSIADELGDSCVFVPTDVS